MSRVAVFIDWQNVYKAAREAFGYATFGDATWPNEFGNFSPYQLARVLAGGRGRGPSAQLLRVEVHRGLPSSSRDPIGFAANRRQSEAWMRENREVVIPRLRPLRYPATEGAPPVEKGVDVNLALGAVEAVITNRADVAVLFSHDSDLLPAVETIVRLVGPDRVETASWKSSTFHQRLRTRDRVHHHAISEDVFRRVETRINYARGD